MKAIKDLFDKLTGGIQPAARTATTTGTAIDLANVQENEFIYATGAWTDGTHTPKLTECDTSGGTYTDVAAADLVGAFSAVSSAAGQNTFQAVSYIGSKRFIKLVVTRSGTTTGMLDAFFASVKYRKQP